MSAPDTPDMDGTYERLSTMTELVPFEENERLVLVVETDDPEALYYAMHALNNDFRNEHGTAQFTVMLDGVVRVGVVEYETEFGMTRDLVLRRSADMAAITTRLRSNSLRLVSELASKGKDMRPTITRDVRRDDTRIQLVEEICRENLEEAPPGLARYARLKFMRWMNEQLEIVGADPFDNSPGAQFWDAVRRAVPTLRDDTSVHTQPRPITGIAPRPGVVRFPLPMRRA